MENYKKEISKYIQHITYGDFEYAVNISLKNKYVYVETPKVGCSTIKNTLHKIELEYPDLVRDDVDDIHDRKYSPLLCPSQTYSLDKILADSSYFKFCFVRDPFERLLSAYLDKVAPANPHKRSVLVAMGEDPSDLTTKISFKEFVDVVCGQDVYDMNAHWRTQYYQTMQGQINYDFIGRMEGFVSDCDFVFSKIVPNYTDYYHSVVRHATNAKDLLGEYYNDDLQAKVSDKFRIDFEYFEYNTKLCFE